MSVTRSQISKRANRSPKKSQSKERHLPLWAARRALSLNTLAARARVRDGIVCWLQGSALAGTLQVQSIVEY